MVKTKDKEKKFKTARGNDPFLQGNNKNDWKVYQQKLWRPRKSGTFLSIKRKNCQIQVSISRKISFRNKDKIRISLGRGKLRN